MPIVHITFKKVQPADGWTETCSWEIWLKIHFNNYLIESCVKLYFIFLIHIYIFINQRMKTIVQERCKLRTPWHTIETFVRFFILIYCWPCILVQLLYKWPTWRTITLFYNTFITLFYMFRATSCSSSGGQIILIQHLV